MAATCPFEIGAPTKACQDLILGNELPNWRWIGIVGPHQLNPRRIWESDVSQIELFVDVHTSLNDTAAGAERIAGLLSLRFFDEKLIEVVFQEGSPGLVLGLSTIINPSPMAGVVVEGL